MLVQMRASTAGALGLWLLTDGTEVALQSAAHVFGTVIQDKSMVSRWPSTMMN